MRSSSLPKQMGRYASRAFTLIEILIVVTLMGIAASLLIPNMSNAVSFETEAAVRQIVADLSFAQSDAMARQAPRRVLFAEDGSGYRILASPFDPENDVLYDPISDGGSGKYIVNFQTDERFRMLALEEVVFDGANNYITYDAIGGPINGENASSIGGSLVVTGSDGRFQINVSGFTGRVSVQRLE
ncbi:MAG: prepilin-type N-terminal cleavage/methylation domain-containing protein [Phycisphaerales bacterium]|nr:prepilin-type N-terminal cleavage/methylation domain-containing protein [Phycisphaerales bacterium]